MSKTPEALRLAELLDEKNAVVYLKHATEAAAEQALDALTIQSDRVIEIGKQREAITALRNRLAQPEQEPKGWRLVPIEPTQEMLRATEAGPVNYPSYCWKAMLSAAPNPPQRTDQEPVVDERIKSVRHMRDVQGYDGNWNYDPYMQGLYNGLEFALSLLEVRQPEFKDAPATWLGDIKFTRDMLSSGAHGIKEKNT